MKHNYGLLAFFAFTCAASVLAQNRSQPQTPTKEDTVVVTTNLVQLDAVVTDRNGHPVTNLQPEDFEVIENGQPRTITSFSYIPLTPEKVSSSMVNKPNTGQTRPPESLQPLRRENVRRAIAIVVDDFGLSFESIVRLRSALEKFIEEQTLSTDLIAVIRSSGGPGAMLQFTSNRTQVLAAVKSLRWYSTGRGRPSAMEYMTPHENNENGVELTGYSANRPPDLSSKEFSGGSLGALALVVQGLAQFPGRKSIVLVSENLPLTTRDAQINGVTRALDKIIEQANQHSIVISTVDARGLPKSGLTADDSQTDLAANQIEKRIRERAIKFAVEQDTLSYLAAQTGGTFIHNNNDLTGALNQIVEGEQGYYLLAYRPDDAEPRNQNRTYKVSLRLKRPELQLRTRSAFYKTGPTRRSEIVSTKNGKLREALLSPFVREDVHVKMTALFIGGSEVKTLLHVNARDLELVRSGEGTFSGSFDIAFVAFDGNGKVVKQFSRSQTLRVPESSYNKLLEDGIVYTLRENILPGAYQVRVALLDNGSGRMGSVSQFVEVPDAKKQQLKVLGFVVQGVDPMPESSAAGEMTGKESVEPGTRAIRSGPAVRRFVAGDLLSYSCLIYGTVRKSAVASPGITSQIKLFRGDKEVFVGDVLPVRTSEQASGRGIIAEGVLRLGSTLAPGQYFLQVIVTDELAPVSRRSAEQWIDFEIVKTGS